MPIDVRQIQPQLNELARKAGEDAARRSATAQHLRHIFSPSLDHDAFLAACLAATHVKDASWNGALFNLGEDANEFIPLGAEPAPLVLLSADGSQIMPDRHKPAPYYLIQIGGTCIAYGRHGIVGDGIESAIEQCDAKWVELVTDSARLFDHNGELIRPGDISNERDLREVEWLAEKCEAFSGTGVQVLAVADGQIVPFALLNERLSPRAQRTMLDRLMAALERIRRSGAWIAGYIDRPNNTALIHAAALAQTPFGDVTAALLRTNEEMTRGVLDRHLLSAHLPDQHRTALFAPTWGVNEKLGIHAMRACYASMAENELGHGVIARLEVPAWCAHADVIGAMCAVLRRHADMGAGYPLILKAAHEAALVSKQDQAEIDELVQQSLVESGLFVERSRKQEAKDMA